MSETALFAWMSGGPNPKKTRAILVGAGLMGIAVLAVVVFAISAALRQNRPAGVPLTPPASATLPLGARAPIDFTLSRLGGGAAVHLGSLVAHRPAVVNLFASWCPACAAELGAFAKVAHRYDNRIAFVGIDTNDFAPAQAVTLLRNAGARYPVARDTANLEFANAYGVSNLPVTFFINRKGRVVGEILGQQSRATLQSRIDELLSGHRLH